MHFYLLSYLFVCFSIGIACLGITLVLAKREEDRLARSFLAFYGTLSVLVIGALLRVFIDGLDQLAPAVRFAVEYLETIIGRYGFMLMLPLFFHRVFAVEQPKRDRLIIALVIAAAVVQHLTEFVLGGVWDDRGDVFEDVFTAIEIAYVVWLGFSRLHAKGVYGPLAVRLLAVLSISLPGIAYDLFLSDDFTFRFYPLMYCVASVVITWTLMRRRDAGVGAAIPANWGLSEREEEVARLVQDGLSNKEIAERLHISLNTVKTHLRAVFGKSGVRSRFELISATRANQINSPEE